MKYTLVFPRFALVCLLALAALAMMTGCGGGGGHAGKSGINAGVEQVRGTLDRLNYASPMTVVTLSSESTVSDTGDFQVTAPSASPSLSVATNADGQPMLLGWIGGGTKRADAPELSARSTAEVLLFYGIGAHMVPDTQTDAIRTLIAQHPATATLANTIETRLKANPNALAEGDSEIIAALDAAISSICGNRSVRGSIVDPGGSQSGIDVQNITDGTAINSVKITNNYRRRGWAYIIHTKDYVKQAGGNVVAVERNLPVLDTKIDSVTGLNGTVGTLSDILSGNKAYQPKTFGPFQLQPTSDENVTKSEFDIIVVGPGNPAHRNNEAENKLTQVMVQKRREVDTMWFFCDVALPVLTTVLPWKAADLNGLGGMENLLKDLSNDVAPQVPNVVAAINEDNYKDAFGQFATAVANSGSLRQVIANRILAHIGSNAALSPQQFLKVQKLFMQVLNAVNIADRITGAFDIGTVLTNVTNSRTADIWTVTTTKPHVEISPTSGEVYSSESISFSSAVKDGSDTVTGNIRFKWTCDSGFTAGEFETSNSVHGSEVTTTDDHVKFNATDGISEEKTGKIYCEAQQFDSEKNTWAIIGKESATVKVKPLVGSGSLFSMSNTFDDGGSPRTSWVVGVKFPKMTSAKTYKVHGFNYNDPAFWGTQFTVFGAGDSWSNPSFGIGAGYASQTDPAYEYVGLTGGTGPGSDASESIAWGLGRFAGGIFEVTIDTKQ